MNVLSSMDFLQHLTPEQRQMLVRLPYRIGLLISQSDHAGGEEATTQELQSLSNIIHGFAQEIFSSEDVQNIMSEAINRKGEWVSWGDDIKTVPAECRMVMDFLAGHADRKDMAALRNHLMEIGEAVAMSFCERKLSGFEKYKLYLNYLMQGKALHRRYSFKGFVSISPQERKALKSVASALGAHY